MKTILYTFFVLGLPGLVYSQIETKLDQTQKIDKIKMNPYPYLEQGGTMTDEIMDLPEKEVPIITSDFVIYPNNSSPEEEKSSLFSSTTDYLDAGLMRDQASEDYRTAKDLWIDQNKALYHLNTRPTDTPEQKLIRNQKK